jgi:hypothetical protein
VNQGKKEDFGKGQSILPSKQFMIGKRAAEKDKKCKESVKSERHWPKTFGTGIVQNIRQRGTGIVQNNRQKKSLIQFWKKAD